MDPETQLNPVALEYTAPIPARRESLLRELLFLAGPVFAEQVLHMLVGLNDTYLANHVEAHASAKNAAASAAVGTVSYMLWFVGLMTGAVGTGATAIIARATGAKHRSLANSIVPTNLRRLHNVILIAEVSPDTISKTLLV